MKIFDSNKNKDCDVYSLRDLEWRMNPRRGDHIILSKKHERLCSVWTINRSIILYSPKTGTYILFVHVPSIDQYQGFTYDDKNQKFQGRSNFYLTFE